MTGLEADTQLLKNLAKFAKLTPAAIAKRAGVAVTTINRPYSGTSNTRLSQPTLEKLRAAFPDFPGWQNAVPTGSASDRKEDGDRDGDSLAIPMLELAYGMGGTFLDGVNEGGTVEHFPRSFVRMFTSAPASHLWFSHGIGDSMHPTIGDRDLLLIDRSRDTVRVNDQIWVLSVGGIGMVKRVRVGGGRILLLSDNENVPDYEAAEDELVVIGRVIAVVRRV